MMQENSNENIPHKRCKEDPCGYEILISVRKWKRLFILFQNLDLKRWNDNR